MVDKYRRYFDNKVEAKTEFGWLSFCYQKYIITLLLLDRLLGATATSTSSTKNDERTIISECFYFPRFKKIGRKTVSLHSHHTRTSDCDSD